MIKFLRVSRCALIGVCLGTVVYLAHAELNVLSFLQVSRGVGSTSPSSGSPESVVSPNSNLVIFSSFATNIVSPPTTGERQIYARDEKGEVSLISVSAEGEAGNEASFEPAVSQTEVDGSFGVAFSSYATSLAPINGGFSERSQVFLRLPSRNKTILISRGFASAATPGDGQSNRPSIASIEGGKKYVVTFLSTSLNHIEGYNPCPDPNDQLCSTRARVYFAMVDASSGSVSMGVFKPTSGGQEPNGSFYSADINGVGDTLAFVTDSTNINWGETITTGGFRQVGLAKKESTSARLLSKPTNSTSPVAGDGDSTEASISFKGNKVVFRTIASNILNSNVDAPSIVLYSAETGALTRVNENKDGVRGNGSLNELFRIDPRGRFVILIDDSDNYVNDDANNFTEAFNEQDVFIKDMETGDIVRINKNADGSEVTDGQSKSPSMGTLGYNSLLSTAGFVSSSTSLPTLSADGQDVVYRVRLEFAAPALSEDTRIETPPDIKRKPRRLDLVLQKFASISDEAHSAQAPSVEAATNITYDIRLRRSGSKRERRLTSTRNRVSIRNLRPGKYTVRYRVRGSKGSTKVSSTFSPKASVVVRGA